MEYIRHGFIICLLACAICLDNSVADEISAIAYSTSSPLDSSSSDSSSSASSSSSQSRSSSMTSDNSEPDTVDVTTADDADTAFDWKKRKIICLYNSKNFYVQNFTPDNIDPAMCTHINYEFAMLDNFTHTLIIGDPSLDIQRDFYAKTTALKNKNKDLKVMLSLGGWVDSTKKYSILVEDPAMRKTFIDHVVPFLIVHNFDGLDVNWQYPNGWQGNIGCSPKDKPNFAIFLKELRQAFDEKNLELSVSVAASPEEIEAAYDVPAVSEAVDHINVMAFDMHGHWDGVTGHHAQFIRKSHDRVHLNLEDSLGRWVGRGADRVKLMVGIPSYGRSYTLKLASSNDMGAPITGPGKPGTVTRQHGYLAFHEICKNILYGNWTEREDQKAGPYAFSGDQWVAYDSLKEVVRKVKFSIDNGFGGILMKDLSSDDFKGECYKTPFPFLKTIKLELIKREKIDKI